MKEQALLFVRLKQQEPCINVFPKAKGFNIKHIWNDGRSFLFTADKLFYECDRNFLIQHPFLSCFTEIQLIKPRFQTEM